MKQNEILPFTATRMEQDITILSWTEKVSIIWYRLYVESKKMKQMNSFTKQKQTQKTNLGLPNGESGKEEG